MHSINHCWILRLKKFMINQEIYELEMHLKYLRKCTRGIQKDTNWNTIRKSFSIVFEKIFFSQTINISINLFNSFLIWTQFGDDEFLLVTYSGVSLDWTRGVNFFALMEFCYSYNFSWKISYFFLIMEVSCHNKQMWMLVFNWNLGILKQK